MQTTENGSTPRTLGRADVAALIGRTLATVDNYRCKGIMPPEIKLPSGAVRWFEADIMEWLRSHQVEKVAVA